MRILLLDVETAPHKVYAWGLYDQDIAINQIVEPGYTLCWAAKWLHDKELMFDSIRKSGKRRMINHIHKLMTEADAIITYNGNKFDLPVLNQEILQLKLKPPPPTAQIDLYQTAKRKFRFASNKLDFISQELKLGRKHPHKGMDLWAGCMKGNAQDWKVMERYNKQDVRLLEKVYNKMLPWIRNHPNIGNYMDKDGVCPQCGSRRIHSNGTRRTSVSVYVRFQCDDCGAWSRGALSEPRYRRDGSKIRPLRTA